MKNKGFLVFLDSDGCVFDTMTVKHKECFIPLTIEFFGLESISDSATEVLEYVNLNSATRGANRFVSLYKALSLIEKRSDLNVTFPKLCELENWLKTEEKPSMPTLSDYICGHPYEKTLVTALEWSKAVNEAIAKLNTPMRPFCGASECIRKLSEKANIAVVSTSPEHIIKAEWSRYGLSEYVENFAGQESGIKIDSIYKLSIGYDKSCVIMLGDAAGDRKAARANGVHFFPIIPGHETESWADFENNCIERFLRNGFDEAYQESLDDKYDKIMSMVPEWLIK